VADKSADPRVVCKPSRHAFELALAQCGVVCKDARQVIFLDDSLCNVQGASALGMFTVHVGESEAQSGVNVAVPTLQNLRTALPELLNSPSIASMDVLPEPIPTPA